MAQIDSSIPLQVKNFQLQSPFEQAAPVLNMLGLLQQQKLREAHMAQQAQMNPLQMQLLQAQIEVAKEIPGQRQATHAKTLLELRQAMERDAAQKRLGLELAKPDEATALEAARQADARGEQFRIEARNPNTVQSLFAQIAPQQAATQMLRPPPAGAQTGLAKLIAERSALPPGDPRIKIYDDAIAKSSTHQAPVNVYSGSLTPARSATGQDVYLQPSGRPDTPPRVVEGFAPPPSKTAVAPPQGYKFNAQGDLEFIRGGPADPMRKPGVASEEATIASVRQRVERMTQMVQSNAALVGPAGIARRIGETGLGMVQPGAATPALDYQNELRLLLADVRKVVEKDPNLSNEERRNLYETLGGGTFQTPGSAIRALNNVISYVEGKKVIGGTRQQPTQPTTEDLEFTARKHGVTVDEVKRRLGIQ